MTTDSDSVTKSCFVLDRRTLAFHEAGHAIIAVTQRRGFSHVTIEDSADAFGHVKIAKPLKFRHLDELNSLIESRSRSRRRTTLESLYTRYLRAWEKELLVIAGGPVAESLYSCSARIAGSDAEDVEKGARFLEERTGEAWQVIVGRTFGRCKKILQDSWPAVESLADALLVTNTMRSASVRQIVAHSTRPPVSNPPKADTSGVGA